MRSLSVCAVVLGLLSVSSLALADGREDKSNSQFSLRTGDLAGGAGEMGRAKAREGDCATALDYFDRAIAVHPEPTLVRDRGLCHDKLNQPYPAIRDLRAYLSERPDAPDADQIRTRLGALESSVGISKEDNKGDPTNVADTPAQRTALENLIDEERLADDSATSPLRRAPGFSLGVYGGVRTYFGSGQGKLNSDGSVTPQVKGFFDTGKSESLNYEVGITGRYAVGPYFDFLLQGGLVSTGKVGSSDSASGPGFLLAGQLRIPFGKYSSDQLLIALGPGYERYSQKTFATLSQINVLGRLGYRHVFGHNLGLEFAGYGGLAHISFVDAPLNANIADVDVGMLGLQLNVLLGF